MDKLNNIVDKLIEKYGQVAPATPGTPAVPDPEKLTDANRLALINVFDQVHSIYASLYQVMEGSQPTKLFNSNKANDLYTNLKNNKAVLTNSQAKLFLSNLNNALNTLNDKVNAAKQSLQQVDFTPQPQNTNPTT